MKGPGMDKVREALAELVACDDAEQEHIALDYFVFRNMASAEQVARWRETDTKDRKPLAMAAAREALSVQHADPMDTPLPCDVKVGHGTHRKGTSLRTLVARMKMLHEAAFGPEPTQAEKDANLAVLQGAQPAPSVPAVPEGWQLVPKEPTDEMVDATHHGQPVSDIYRDMLAAAGKPEANQS